MNAQVDHSSPTKLNPYTTYTSTSGKTQIHTHQPSRFMPYALDKKNHSATLPKTQTPTSDPEPPQISPTHSANTPSPVSTSPTNATSPL
jgi:hypothetical protein